LIPAPANPDSYRPWLHRWAVLTAVAVFPLLVIGGLVTSFRVGMADPVAVRSPWYLLELWWENVTALRGIGYLIEHTHRQVGWIAGMLTIVLAVWLWCVEPRRWLRWLGVAALAAVSFQGILGILRIQLHALWGVEFSMIHGFCAQLVFGLLASIALFTSRSWLTGPPTELDDPARFQRLCLITTLLLLLQLSLGVWLRQAGRALEAHVLVALAVAAHALMLGVRVFFWWQQPVSLFRRLALALGLLVLLQLALGLGAWWVGAGKGALDYREVTMARAILTTAHVGTGALLLAASLLLTWCSYRHLVAGPKLGTLPLRTTEGTA
jgi:cytochrome c oxidase assembly protein subunit 15